MRKYRFISFWLLLMLGLATVVFNSCSKDDKDGPKKEVTDPDPADPNNPGIAKKIKIIINSKKLLLTF